MKTISIFEITLPIWLFDTQNTNSVYEGMMEMGMETDVVNAATTLTLTEEDLAHYIAGRRAAGLGEGAAAKYRSHLQHLCNWLPEGKVITKELLLQWRSELETNAYSKVTVEKYVTDINSYVKYKGRPDLNIKKSRAYDLRGQTFGYLTAIEPTGERKRTDVMWRCRCKCGKEIDVAASLLVRGNTTSCGCLAGEIFDYHNRYVDGTELRQSMADNPISTRAASGYTGVTKDRGKWRASITYKKKYYKLGLYYKLEDAVKARARAKDEVMADAAALYAATDHLYTTRPARPPRPQPAPKREAKRVYPARRSDNTSGCSGVRCEGIRWKAELSMNGMRYHLGLYDQWEDAVAVRKKAEALALLGDEKGVAAMSRSAKPYTKTKKTDIEKGGNDCHAGETKE